MGGVVLWGKRPGGPNQWGEGHLLVAILIVCTIHPFPGTFAFSETYPDTKGAHVLSNEFLENRWERISNLLYLYTALVVVPSDFPSLIYPQAEASAPNETSSSFFLL